MNTLKSPQPPGFSTSQSPDSSLDSAGTSLCLSICWFRRALQSIIMETLGFQSIVHCSSQDASSPRTSSFLHSLCAITKS